jgi:solute carrier family 25 citrate transporter 1
LDATIKIIRSEGFSGIYRGLIPTILKQGTNQLIRFPIQQFYMKLIFGNNLEKSSSPILNGLCGAMAGGTSVVLTMPQDTIKTRMQGEEAKKLYKGFFDCVKKTVQKEGVRFLWTGTWPRFVRVTLDVGITFTIYPFLKKLI